MKTLLITLEYPPFKGGVANYYSNLAKYWPLGEHINVLDNSRGDLMAAQGLFPWLKAVSTILKWHKEEDFDHLLVGHILPLGTAAIIAAFIHPFPFSVVLHGLDFSSAISSPRKRLLTRIILARAQKIICANSYTAELVRQFNKKLAHKVSVVNPGIEPIIPKESCDKLQELKEQYNLEGKFVLFSLGRLVARKGFDTVIKALSGRDFAVSNLVYFIAGLGPEEHHLRSLAAVSPLKNKIFFLGSITEEEKWCWLYACDAFILPTRAIGHDFEGFGIVYLEANLAGRAVIAGDSGGVRDAVIHRENGLLVPPEDTEAIREAIRQLAENKEWCQQLGANGQVRAARDFKWDKQARALCRILKD